MLSLLQDINPYYELAVLSPENRPGSVKTFEEHGFKLQTSSSFPVRTLARLTKDNADHNEKTQLILHQLGCKETWRHNAINLDSV